MIILRQKEFSSEEYQRLKKMYPNWSEKQIQTKLKLSAKFDRVVNKMGKKVEKVRTEFIKKPVHFSNTSENQYEQKEFGKVGDWLRGNTEKDKARMKKRMDKRIDKLISSNPNVPREDEWVTKITNKEYKRAKNINRAGKVAMIATPILAVGGTALALRKKNKKEE